MRFLLLLISVSLTGLLFAQNPDYPDYRRKTEMFSRIQEKDIRSDIASFSMGGLDESVGKLPLKTLPISQATNNSISFDGGNIKVKITAAPFDKAKHKLAFYETSYLVKIDNKPYYGDYGTIPKTNVASVELIIDRDTIRVPEAACTDLCNPIFSYKERGVEKSNNKVYLSADGHRIYVYMLKQEAGGSYEVTWVFQDKKYVKRVVDFGFLK
jgi:hypothetical protein